MLHFILPLLTFIAVLRIRAFLLHVGVDDQNSSCDFLQDGLVAGPVAHVSQHFHLLDAEIKLQL